MEFSGHHCPKKERENWEYGSFNSPPLPDPRGFASTSQTALYERCDHHMCSMTSEISTQGDHTHLVERSAEKEVEIGDG